MAPGSTAGRSLKGQASLQLVLGLGGAIAVVILVGVIGAIKVSNDHGSKKHQITSTAPSPGVSPGNVAEIGTGATTTAPGQTATTTASGGAGGGAGGASGGSPAGGGAASGGAA